jgi:predicted transcriptional regulator
MKNITITVDDEVARWARIWAAKHNTSVSRLLGEVLAERMRRESDYEAAMERFLRKPPRRLRESGQPLPPRAELYER